MTVVQPPTWMEYGTYDAKNDRLHGSAMLATAGIVRSNSFAIAALSPTPLMKVTVASGVAFIDAGTFEANSGYYVFINDAPITVDISPSDPTLPRIDLVVARVYDGYYEGTANKGEIEVIRGDTNISPVVKTLPKGSIELGRITVPAGATSITAGNINMAAKPTALIRDTLIAGSDSWFSYTPSLTVDSGTNPTNYTASGRYKVVGKVVTLQFSISMGASFTPGSPGASYRISTPVSGVVNGMTAGHARIYDSSTGSAHLDARTSLGSAAAFALQITTSHGGPLGNVGPSVPWTWATGDIMDGFITYEAV